jgi:transposase InsO family protein
VAKFSASARRRFARVGTGTGSCLRYRLPQSAERLPRAPKLSREARVRLRYLGYARTHPVAATCARFGIARSTCYRWRRRYDPANLHSLEDRPSWPHARHRRPYAVRKPKDHPVARPGDLVQVDTMQLRPLPGVERRQFTAVDAVSRLAVVEVRAVATAGTAAAFLDALEARAPFPVRAIQVDRGSESKAAFEAACQERGIALFVLPPRSPKLNGRVERANRTFREEFWECYEGPLELPLLQAALPAAERAYNAVRPHQALGYQTPAALLAAHGEPHL